VPKPDHSFEGQNRRAASHADAKAGDSSEASAGKQTLRPARRVDHAALVDKPRDRRLRILLVESQPGIRSALERSLTGPGLQIEQAETLAQARRRLAQGPIDLAIVGQDLSDGPGLSLTRDLNDARHHVPAIVLAQRPSLQHAVEAMRAGAADVISMPLDLREVNERVRAALARRGADLRREQRTRRLRRLCHKLDQARQDVSRQVDILCNDLITAYQELAHQMNRATLGGEYAGLVRHELDLETMLRRTLEFFLRVCGPTNAAVFLPSNENEYGLGGYVNYECNAQSADFLLQHLADVMAPKVASQDQVIHLTDNAAIQQWIGDDSAYLADSHVLAFVARHENEPLAVVMLFRDAGQPFSSQAIETCAAVAPMMSQFLARIIRVHHRGLNTSDDPREGQDETGDFDPAS